MGFYGKFKGLGETLGDFGIKDTKGFVSALGTAFVTGDNSGLTDFLQKNMSSNEDLPCETCCRPCRIAGGDFCPRCIELQKPFAKGLAELRTMEAAIDGAANGAPKPAPACCSLCGAPYEENETECPWCGTPYPAGAGAAALPADIGQLKLLYRRRCEEVWKLYTDFYPVYQEAVMKKFRGNLILDNPFSKYVTSYSMNKQKMTSEQIFAGAEKYNVPVSAYLLGVVTGQYENVGTMTAIEALQKRSQALDEMNKLAEKNLEIEREKNAKLRAIRLEEAARQVKMAKSRVAGYGGASDGLVCGTCVNYMSSGKCAAGHGTFGLTNASDSASFCGDYSRK